MAPKHTRKAPTMTTALPENKYGISFVDEADVPPPPRPRTVETERWEAVKMLLTNAYEKGGIKNKFALAHTYPSAQGAQSKSSQINSNRAEVFPAIEWEARSKVTKKSSETDKGESQLFLAYKGPAEVSPDKDQAKQPDTSKK